MKDSIVTCAYINIHLDMASLRSLWLCEIDPALDIAEGRSTSVSICCDLL